MPSPGPTVLSRGSTPLAVLVVDRARLPRVPTLPGRSPSALPIVRAFVAAAVGATLLMAAVGTAVVASAVSLLGGGGPVVGAAAARIPPAMLALYQEAAATCIGLPWTVLAAIGTVESDNGQSDLPGVHSGVNPAGAEGPMQFEPATFAAYATPVPPGGTKPPSPYDPTDAVFAAARFLCANGAAGGANLPAAVYAYNHSAAYVSEVLTLAESYGEGSGGGPVAGSRYRCGRGRVGAVPGRHALRLGRGDTGSRLRLLGSGAGGIPRGRHRTATGGPGPVRLHACGAGGPAARARGPRLLRRRADGRRPRRPLRRRQRGTRR